MTCEQAYGWCVGFSGMLESGREGRLGKLWQRLLSSVCSEEALAEATRGPRVAWNPYRPARGEHLLQGILNSEVYEWRSAVAVNSLRLHGTALSTDGLPQSPLNTVHNIKFFHLEANVSGITTNGLSSDRTAAQCSERTGPSCEIESETIEGMCNENNRENILRSTEPQDVIDDIFEVLWRTFAVPWIIERHASGHQLRREKREPETHDNSTAILSFYCADPVRRFAGKPNRNNDLVPNRRRPTTGPAMRRGGTERRAAPALPDEKKTPLLLLHTEASLKKEFVDVAREEGHPVAVARQGVQFLNEVGHSPKQKRVSSFRLSVLASSGNAEAERRRSLLLGKPTIGRPTLHCKGDHPFSSVLHPRDNSSPDRRHSPKGKKNNVFAKKLDRGAQNVRALSGCRGCKLAPLPRKARVCSPTIIKHQNEEV
ncbi:hypothetical protein C3747_19g39 [Trypanosoma cruzi]|uniref:Uncharacterized protein n=1 Tax=Trypanosoma cruzi TaxID=5693 RepID=A0A2V2XAF5_TRYCR|nr:hypothetical protein C3747_19g39 [Trypanosoma cruzi]